MIYLDIETLDFFQDEHIKRLARNEQLKAMRFGCAVTWTDYHNFNSWAPDEVDDLYAWLLDGDPLVVGWNIKAFDIPVIAANMTDADLAATQPRTYDIFAEIRNATGRWYSLETVAQHNLGHGKLADGQHAAEWLRSEDPDLKAKAIEYCRHDVQLVMELHALLIDGQPLKLPPRLDRGELNEIYYYRDGRTERIPDATGTISTK